MDMYPSHYQDVPDVPSIDLRPGDVIVHRQRDGLFTVSRTSLTVEVPC